MYKMTVAMLIVTSPLCHAQDRGHITVKMSDEARKIAAAAEKWNEAWRCNDKESLVELMRPEDPRFPDQILRVGKQLSAYFDDNPYKCLIISLSEQTPSMAMVHLYPMSLPGRQISFGLAMSKQDGKWYVQGASGVEIDDLAIHYRKWADKFEKHEIWYDEKAPEWLKPGQKESEVAKKIAEIKVTDRKLYQESYGHLLADINKELFEGGRLQRSQLLKAIHKIRLSVIFNDSSIKPLRSCLKSEDVGMTNLARKMYLELRQEVREQRERDASKIPQSAEEYRVLSEEYSRKVSKLDKALVGYRSKQIYSDFLEVLEKEVLPVVHKGRTAGEQKGRIYRQEPNAFKNSTFDEKKSQPAIADIEAAVLKGIYEEFVGAVDEGILRLPDDKQSRIFYWAGLAEFKSRQELIEKPYEEHCPFEEGTMEYYQFMDAVGQSCMQLWSPLMRMVEQLSYELEDAREEVEIMYKWLELGSKNRGNAKMPELYEEPYLNKIKELSKMEG
ncbi:MAG: nuclear transport factor 2 family protein [Planctomycetota bacterium]